MSRADSAFLKALDQRVLVFDGAMGTSVHALDLPLSDYRGLENCTEVLNLSRPDAVEQIHRTFFEVGCDAVETNTFGGMKHVLAEFDLAERCYEINLAAAQIARRAANAFSTPARPRFVAGSMGPGTKLISLRQIDYEAMLDSYFTQARGLIDGGVDLMMIETCQDILQLKTALHAVRLAFEKAGRDLPLVCQVTMETTGTMLVGTDIAGALTAIEAYPEVDVIGLNCATGPQEMSEHIRFLARQCTRRLSVLPNAGLPQLVEGRTHFPLSPAELARWLKEFVEVDGVNLVGGCCGTTPEHLRAVVAAVGDLKSSGYRVASNEIGATAARSTRSSLLATRNSAHEPACSSLYQAVPYRQDNSVLIVGERCNTNGSRQFKRLLAEGDLDGLVNMAIEQVKEEGAHVLDVCVDYVGREGAPDMQRVVDRFAREVTAPLMLDSTQVDVLEAGLKLAGGKCIINSVNLEDGEEKLGRIARLCRQFGAAVVALTIDEDPVEAMAKTADRKLAIAERIHDLLTRRHGMNEEDIFWDCLTFPITTGNEADRRLGLETLDGIERVMKRFPRCQSILGLSNISFGLQPAARVVLNSVFLHEARQRGLTAAIVHAAKILPRNQISDERWNAALDLIYDRRESPAESAPVASGPPAESIPVPSTTPAGSAAVASGPPAGRPGDDTPPDPLARYIALFQEGEQLGQKVKIADLPIEERLKQRIVDGARQGIEKDLDEARQRYAPLEIINTFLLDGMKVVGELFGSGQMQLPFVLKSAETMKAAVAALEPYMEKAAGSSRGKIVLATVRGDVHDIGKNLVDIILTNNGFTVFNLGIKQPINNIIAAWREHGADAIGLSGLLVKSTLVMRDDLLVLNEQDIRVPVILGGAALTRRYVEEDLRPQYRGALHYAKDAFDGLRLMREIVGETAGECGHPARTEPEMVRSDRADGAAQLAVAHDGVPRRAPRPAPVAEPLETAAARRSGDQLLAELEQRYGLREVDDATTPMPSAPVPSGADRIAASAIAGGIATAPAVGVSRASDLRHDAPVPTPPFWGERVIERIPLKAALAFLNETMLFQVQWGFRKKGRTSAEWKQHVNAEIRPLYRELVERCEREGILQPQAVYGYWPCNSDGDDLVVYEPPRGRGSEPAAATSTPQPLDPLDPSSLTELARFTFPRQKKAPHWCLSDFWRPVEGGVADVVAFHIVTAGQRVSEVARQWFAANDYQQYLFLHGLGVETAEALAEYLHKQIRSELGVGGQDARELQMLFKQGYQGSRYSFGYPACPRLEDQAILMRLLRPERIGITLSEEYQLDPEQSTSAIITYHPDACYFNVR